MEAGIGARPQRVIPAERGARSLLPTVVGQLRTLRFRGAPGAAIAVVRMNTEIDVRPRPYPLSASRRWFSTVEATRPVQVEEGRYLASKIQAARLRTSLLRADHDEWVGDTESVLAEVEEFVTGARPTTRSQTECSPLCFSRTILLDPLSRRGNSADRTFGETCWKDHRAAVLGL